jgi:hypothetical protein
MEMRRGGSWGDGVWDRIRNPGWKFGETSGRSGPWRELGIERSEIPVSSLIDHLLSTGRRKKIYTEYKIANKI